MLSSGTDGRVQAVTSGYGRASYVRLRRSCYGTTGFGKVRFGQLWSVGRVRAGSGMLCCGWVIQGGLGAVGLVAALRVPLRFGWARQGGRVRLCHWVGESGCGFIRRSN